MASGGRRMAATGSQHQDGARIIVADATIDLSVQKIPPSCGVSPSVVAESLIADFAFRERPRLDQLGAGGLSEDLVLHMRYWMTTKRHARRRYSQQHLTLRLPREIDNVGCSAMRLWSHSPPGRIRQCRADQVSLINDCPSPECWAPNSRGKGAAPRLETSPPPPTTRHCRGTSRATGPRSLSRVRTPQPLARRQPVCR